LCVLTWLHRNTFPIYAFKWPQSVSLAVQGLRLLNYACYVRFDVPLSTNYAFDTSYSNSTIITNPQQQGDRSTGVITAKQADYSTRTRIWFILQTGDAFQEVLRQIAASILFPCVSTRAVRSLIRRTLVYPLVPHYPRLFDVFDHCFDKSVPSPYLANGKVTRQSRKQQGRPLLIESKRLARSDHRLGTQSLD
jgi:hypothetical protein